MGPVRGEGCERYLGISILELVLRRLRQENFAADVAYPGQKFPQVTGPVAAVHIEKVDRAAMTVTVEVNVICPAAMGGTTCETEALRATEVLRLMGAVCVQNGCTYDGIAQVYVVPVLAAFTGVADVDSYTRGPGFRVYIDDALQLDVVAVSEEETIAAQPEGAMGQGTSARSSLTGRAWTIRLEELIPAGYEEMENPTGEFTMQIATELKTEVYSGCRWTSVHREYTKEGLRRIRTGFALNREEC